MLYAAIALGVIVLAAAALFAAAQAIFNFAFKREDHIDKKYSSDAGLDFAFLSQINEGMAAIEKLPFEPLSITSHDGYKLYGRMYLAEGAKTTVVLVHGYRSASAHDFSCVYDKFLSAGCNVFLVTQRAHDDSEGKYISFGWHERRDICAWCTLISEKYGTGIILDGISMGSTSVLLAASLPEMTNKLRGVIADCGYDNARDEFIHVAKNYMHLPVQPLLSMVCAMARRRVGLDARLSVSEEIAGIRAPVLFVHGAADDFVPYENVEKIYAACPTEKKLVRVEGAGHGLSYLVDPERCGAELSAFIERVRDA